MSVDSGGAGGTPLAAHGPPGNRPDIPHQPLSAWQERWPRLMAGITTAGEPHGAFDLRLDANPRPEVVDRWETLQSWSGLPVVVHALQVHGTDVLVHGPAAPGWYVSSGADGHVTDQAGTLLTVSVADCVPVYLFDPEAPALGLLHAGRKGVASGILERGIEAMVGRGAEVGRLHVHLGPAICGICYEVGPEVHAELGLPVPDEPTPVDLRAILLQQAARAGLAPERSTVSSLCTRCTPSAGLFSHRAGHAGRQMAYLGLRDR